MNQCCVIAGDPHLSWLYQNLFIVIKIKPRIKVIFGLTFWLFAFWARNCRCWCIQSYKLRSCMTRTFSLFGIRAVPNLRLSFFIVSSWYLTDSTHIKLFRNLYSRLLVAMTKADKRLKNICNFKTSIVFVHSCLNINRHKSPPIPSPI